MISSRPHSGVWTKLILGRVGTGFWVILLWGSDRNVIEAISW